MANTWGAGVTGQGPRSGVPPPSWEALVEKAHSTLYRAAEILTGRARPSAFIVDALPPLRRAFVSVYDALDGRDVPGHALRAAVVGVEAALHALASAPRLDEALPVALEALGEARQGLLEAETCVPLRMAPPPKAPELRASFAVPTLHLLDRPSLAPAFRVPTPPPPEVGATPPSPPPQPTTFDALKEASEQRRAQAKAALKAAKTRAGRKPKPAKAEPRAPVEVPPGFAREVGPALSEAEFLRRQVRELFEEVVLAGLHRVPLPGDDWRSSRVLERRILAAIDALAALGPQALAELEPLVLDSPVKDPSRLFALTMILGCVAGRDTLAAAERVFWAWERADLAHARAFADALKLVPHPAVRALLGSYLVDTEPTHRALAAEVLVYRGTATLEQLAQAATDVPEVASFALPAYALTRHPGASDVTRAALSSAHGGLREAAWLAMAYRGAPALAPLLRSELAGPLAERAALLLALVGGASDAHALLERAAQGPTPGLVQALGWAGDVGAVDFLIGLLEHDDEEVQGAAAEALERLTGATLLEEVPVEPEEIAVPDVPDPPVDERPGRPSLAYEVSDPRDMPEEGAPDTLTRPSRNPAVWRAYWQANARGFDSAKRTRRGKPSSPLVSLGELEGGGLSPNERRLIRRELTVRTGDFVRFDPHDFVLSQETALEQWRPLAQRASGAPGSWQLPARPRT